MHHRSLYVDSIPSSELLFPSSAFEEGIRRRCWWFWHENTRCVRPFRKEKGAVNVFYSQSHKAFTSQDKKPKPGCAKIRFD